MLVYYKIETNYCGEDEEGIIKFPDFYKYDDIEEYINTLADENANGWGMIGDFQPVGLDEDGEEIDYDGYHESDYRESYYNFETIEENDPRVEIYDINDY